MKHVTLVTVNYNSEQETHNLLTSLQKLHKDSFSFSVIVVDNASQTPFVLSGEEKRQGIVLITTEKNFGFTGGYNVGIQRALENSVDYVVIINNDTLVDPDFIEHFLETFSNNQQAGLVVPKIYFAKGHEYHKDRYKESEKGKVFWYAGGFMDWKNVFSKHRGVDEVDTGQYDMLESIDFATGCCMCFPADVLQKVGGFDDSLFLYFEDADLSQRILRAGYTILYQPKSVIWHVNAASGGGSGSPLHDYYITRNRMVFGMRYAPLRAKFALIRESIRLFFAGRPWQKRGIKDFYVKNLGKGSFGK